MGGVAGYTSDFVARVTAAFEAQRNPDLAPAMAAYMREQFAFLGIPTPQRRALTRTLLSGATPPTERQLAARPALVRHSQVVVGHGRRAGRFSGGTSTRAPRSRVRDGHLGHPDFFIRKAIGWALREYSKTQPAAVARYVDAMGERLSPLSQREALKRINKP